MTKRIFDILISTFLILIFFPIMILIIVLIKLFEDFDVFFIQKRAGKNGTQWNATMNVHVAEKRTLTSRWMSGGSNECR